MLSYLVVAYPELRPEDLEKIQNFRSQHDELYFNVVDPHFTFVFPVTGISQEEFTREIKLRATNFKNIDFIIRGAKVHNDAFSDFFHVFLVPDEGNEQIIELHDKLYSGKLKEHLRTDLEYIPHIGVGNSKDKSVCTKLADGWNAKEFAISGVISKVTVVKYEENKITELEEIELK